MISYYKGDAETDFGDGTIFVELDDDGYATRQIGLFNGNWYWAEQSAQSDDNFFLADQPINPDDIPTCQALAKEEFEKKWMEAKGAT